LCQVLVTFLLFLHSVFSETQSAKKRRKKLEEQEPTIGLDLPGGLPEAVDVELQPSFECAMGRFAHLLSGIAAVELL